MEISRCPNENDAEVEDPSFDIYNPSFNLNPLPSATQFPDFLRLEDLTIGPSALSTFFDGAQNDFNATPVLARDDTQPYFATFNHGNNGKIDLTPPTKTDTAVRYPAQQQNPTDYSASEVPNAALWGLQLAAGFPYPLLRNPSGASSAYALPPSNPPSHPTPAMHYQVPPYNPTVSCLATLPHHPPNSVPPSTPHQQQQRHPCPHCDQRIGRKADLIRHIRSIHIRPPVGELFPCPVGRCNRSGENGFVRKDKLGCHMKAVHRVRVAVCRLGNGREIGVNAKRGRIETQ
ncbi:MAG: hypothetical protein M1839_003217 [Geoglossum umbratile]|nr:MAG: hypothetical protein M1839_003217 [Geoglossum umbratile]